MINITFAILRQISEYEWIGTFKGHTIKAKLCDIRKQALWNGVKIGPDVFYIPEMSESDLELVIPELHVTARLKNEYLSLQNPFQEWFRWGQIKLKNSVIMVGQASDLPTNTLLLGALKVSLGCDVDDCNSPDVIPPGSEQDYLGDWVEYSIDTLKKRASEPLDWEDENGKPIILPNTKEIETYKARLRATAAFYLEAEKRADNKNLDT